MSRQTVLCAVWLLLFWITGCSAQNKNGFDLEGALFPVESVLSGGPAKDGIPAINTSFQYHFFQMIWTDV